MYKKIIAAFDGSKGSMKALEHAIQLSKLQYADLTVVHVVKEKNLHSLRREPNVLRSNEVLTPYGFAPREDHYTVAEERDALTGERIITADNDRVLSAAKSKITHKQLSATFKVLEGDPAKKLCEYANSQEADVMVIGSSGISGIKKLMIGSISEKVAKEAEVPVFIVK